MRARLLKAIRSTAGGLPRAFWTLWAGALVNRVGTFVVPFLALYLTERRGLPVSRTGLIVSLWGLGAAAASPVGGWLADRVGRRPTMVGALALGGASMIALGLAQQPEVIAPATLLVGFLGELYRPGLVAAVSDLVPAADRVRAFGLVYWAVNLGMAVAVSVGGLLASVSYLLLFVADGATTLVFGFLVWRWVPETRPGHGAPRPARPAGERGAFVAGLLAPYRDRVFLAFLGLTSVLALIFMQHQLALALDMTAHGVTKAQFGSILAVNGVLIVLFQPIVARVIGGRDKSLVIAAGSVLVALGFGLNAVVHTPALYALGVVVWTFGEMATLPVGTAVVADLAPAELRGRYQGANGLAFGLGSFVAPALGALVLQRLGSAAVWTGCLVAGLAVAAGQLALTGALRRAAADRASPRTPP